MVSQRAGAVEPAQHVAARIGERAVGQLLALRRRHRRSGEAGPPLPGIAGEREQQGRAR